MPVVSQRSAPDRLTRPDLPRVEVYGDESMGRGPFDLLGTLWVPSGHAASLREELAHLRATVDAPNRLCEVKWKKCSGSGAANALFDGFADVVMRWIVRGRAQFKCIVIERALVDDRAWNDGDPELGFFKAWSTLLRSRISPGAVYNVRLDARQLQKKHRLEEMRDVLRRCGKLDHGVDYWCCGTVESRDSKDDDLIQVADLLTGAVGFHWAGGHLDAGASARKVAMAERIASHLRRTSLDFVSPPYERRFNVWRWRPSRPKTQRAP